MKINLTTEVVHRYVFELRYELGQLYWDRAGRTAREVALAEGWDLSGIDGNGCHLSLPDENIALNFSPAKVDLVQTQSADVAALREPGLFGALADQLSQIVVRNLEVEEYPRIGLRAWYLYPARDRNQSYEMIKSLKIAQVDKDLLQKLGETSETSFRLVVERHDHMARIAIAPFEQVVPVPPSTVRAARGRARDLPKGQRQAVIDKIKAKKAVESYPQFGVLVDLDAYIEEPPTDVSVSNFIDNAVKDFGEIKRIVLIPK